MAQNTVRIGRSDDGHLLTLVLEGPYTLPEVKASLTAAVAEEPPSRDCCLLMDIRRSEAAPSQDEIKEFASFLDSLPTHVAKRTAWVVAADLRYGLIRQLSAFAETRGLAVQVFRDAPGALAWLEAGHATDHQGDRATPDED